MGVATKAVPAARRRARNPVAQLDHGVCEFRDPEIIMLNCPKSRGDPSPRRLLTVERFVAPPKAVGVSPEPRTRCPEWFAKADSEDHQVFLE